MDNKSIVISGFPGIGKSYTYRKYIDNDINVLDSDSSLFSWVYDENGNKTNERHPDFPNNYIEHIKENIGKSPFIFVSSHKVVRDALINSGVLFICVYPDISLKDEYLRRYKERGNDDNFIKMMSDNWDNFINEIENDYNLYKYRLHSANGYLDEKCMKEVCEIADMIQRYNTSLNINPEELEIMRSNLDIKRMNADFFTQLKSNDFDYWKPVVKDINKSIKHNDRVDAMTYGICAINAIRKE